MSNYRITFHLNRGPEIEERFESEMAARGRIIDVMQGRVILEADEDGERVFIATHQINGAILHPWTEVEQASDDA